MRAEILETAIKARIFFVMGAKDTGKTTFVRDLANELFRQGYSVGLIDADVGQSDIGPTTTIGLGTVESVLIHLGDATLRQFYFVGATSPKGHILSVMIGARQMLDQALALGLQKIIFDTTGLVAGQLGRVLKEHKIAVVNPDVIICLQAHQECEHILRLYDAFAKPVVLRLAPDSRCRQKTSSERRHYRETALQKYFAQASNIECSFTEIGIFETTLFSGQPLAPQEIQEFSEILWGKHDESQTNELKSQILWGEYIGKELHLVTSHRLEHAQFLKLKQGCPNIAYVRNYTLAEFENILVGILNRRNEFCALGILRSVDFATRQAIIYTSAARQDIAGVKLSNLFLLYRK